MQTNTFEFFSGKYLTFFLNEEEYAIEIQKVEEIIGITELTRVPQAPDFIRGVLNLRGKIIPIIDIRPKFGMDKTPDTKHTCIVILEITTDTDDINIGIVVDAVSEVIDIGSDAIRPTPDFGVKINTEYIHALGQIEQRVFIMLNIDKVLTSKKSHQRAVLPDLTIDC